MHRVLVAVVGFALLISSGCRDDAPPPAPVSAAAKPSADDHAHKPGQFGGTIVPIGSDSYHAEAVFEKGGTVRLYTLGKDEAKVLEVEAQTLSAFAKPEGGAEAEPFELAPKPQ